MIIRQMPQIENICSIVLAKENVMFSAKSFDSTNKNSVLAWFREGQAVLVRSKIEAAFEATGGCRIIDLGGEEAYWRLIGIDCLRACKCSVVLLNQLPAPAASDPMFTVITGDACATGYPDYSFDLVHSNSVIEHVGGWARRVAFSNEVKRLAPSFYIQTPNYYFPLESDFRTIGFQFPPRRVRVALLRITRLGFFDKTPDFTGGGHCRRELPTDHSDRDRPAVRQGCDTL